MDVFFLWKVGHLKPDCLCVMFRVRMSYKNSFCRDFSTCGYNLISCTTLFPYFFQEIRKEKARFTKKIELHVEAVYMPYVMLKLNCEILHCVHKHKPFSAFTFHTNDCVLRYSGGATKDEVVFDSWICSCL